MEQQPDNPVVKNTDKKRRSLPQKVAPLTTVPIAAPFVPGVARWLYSNRQREGGEKNKKQAASWRAAAKGRRASLCIEDEMGKRASERGVGGGGGGKEEEEAARGSSCWQALNVQLLHISPPPQSASLCALCAQDRKPLRARDGAEGWQVAST